MTSHDHMIRVGEQWVEWQEGMTVSQVLETLVDGHIYAVVRLNGRTVSKPNFAETSVPEGSEILPIPMIAGG